MNVNDLIEKIKNNEHIISEEDLIKYPELRKDIIVMKKAIDENCNFVRYVEIRCRGRNDLGRYAIERGFIPTYSDLVDNRYISISPSLKEFYNSNLNTLISEIMQGKHFITEDDLLNYYELRNNFDVMKIAVEHNCNLIAYANLGKDKLEIIAKKALDNGYNPCKEDFFKSGNTFFHTSLVPFKLGNSDLIMLKAIKINPRLVCFNIKYVDYAFECGLKIDKELLDEFPNLLLNDKIFKLALDIDPNYMEQVFFKKSDDYEEYNNSLTIENLKYAIQKGFIPTPEFVRRITIKNIKDKERGNISEFIKEILLICIDINPNSINGYNREIDENIILYAINKGYVPNFNIVKENSFLMDSCIIGNYFLSQNDEWQNNKFLKEYIEKYSSKRLSTNIIIKIWPFISKNDIYEVFSFDEILDIVQYVYLSYEKEYNIRGWHTGKDISNYSELIQDLEYIVDNGTLKKFIMLVNLYANDYPTKEKIDVMQQLSQGFILYNDLINNLFSQDKISKEQLYLLKQLLITEERVEFNDIKDLNLYFQKKFYDNEEKDDFKNVDDLKLYSECLFNKREQKIGCINEDDQFVDQYWDSENDFNMFLVLYEEYFGEVEEDEGFLFLQDQILKMLCNFSLIEYLLFINYDFNSNVIEKLIMTCNGELEKEKLENYKVILEFIESILQCRDFNVLKGIAKKLNEGLYKNSECILPIYESFNRLVIEKRLFFGNELNQNLTRINNLMETEDVKSKDKNYIRQCNKFVASSRELYGEKLDGKTVDFIELRGIDFVFLTHVLNAYGDGAELFDFKYPRLFGRPYICLSAIGDNCLEMASSKIDKVLGGNTVDDYTDSYSQDRINYVTLLFDNFDNNQLALMSCGDLSSYTIQNSLNVESYGLPKFLVTRDLLKFTNNLKSYNECVLYRKDAKGNQIYPSAILARDYRPTQYEIDAAAYLGIPIVYINKEYYLNNTKKCEVSEKIVDDKANDLKEQLQKLKEYLEISPIDISFKKR